MGVCSAEMAEDAVAPVVAELTAGARAVVMPVAGSAFPGGQRPRDGFFRTAQLESPDVTLVPFVCTDDAETVDVEELVDASEEDEFCLWAVFRWGGSLCEHFGGVFRFRRAEAVGISGVVACPC